jgi:hypothetical protein
LVSTELDGPSSYNRRSSYFGGKFYFISFVRLIFERGVHNCFPMQMPRSLFGDTRLLQWFGGWKLPVVALGNGHFWAWRW